MAFLWLVQPLENKVISAHYSPLLLSILRLFCGFQNLLLVKTKKLVVGSSKVPMQWNFLKQWMLPDARKMNDMDLMAWFHVILFYDEVLVIKGALF